MKLYVMVVFFFTSLFAQTGWQTQHPYPTAVSLGSIHAFNQTTAITVGNYTVIKTTDGGVTWKNISTSTQYNFTIQFFNATLGFILGSDIHKTTDGGETWTKITPTISAFYNSIKIFSPDSIYVGGSYGNTLYFLKTTNGGTTWNSTTVSTKSGISSMFALNPQYIWIGHFKDGSIWKSTDGGTTWGQTLTGAGQYLTDIYFKDTTSGVAVSELGLYATTDGGKTWGVKTVAGSNSGKFSFIDANNGWLRGSSLSKTTNGGTTWTAVGNPPSGAAGHQFISSTVGWIVGNGGLVATTSDGGVTWTKKNSSQTTNSCTDVQFFNADTGWVITNTEFLKTTNGGTVWNKLKTFLGFSAYEFRFVDSQNGWVVGNSQGGLNSAWKTNNGGLSWTGFSTGVNKTHYAVSMVDANNVWIAVDSGYVVSTTDGGSTWTKLLVGTSRAMTEIWMVTASTGYTTDDKGGVYKTTDGGKTWVNKLAPFATSITSLWMIDENTGWITFGSSAAKKTTDGGSTWSSVSIGIENLRDIQFVNSTIGFTCSQNSWFYGTTDGGTTWTKKSGAGDVNALYFVSPTVGYAAGFSGLIARTNNAGGLTEVKNISKRTIPQKFSLSQNYPNPFNPSTVINYQLPMNSHVILKIYDVLGKEIAVLVNEEHSAGNYSINFEASKLSNGMYFYRLQAGNTIETKRMMLIK